MMSRLKYFVFACLCIFISCKKENALDCFKSTGKEKQESRTMQAFDMINITDKFEVELLQGNEYKVEISAGEHLIKNILTSVNGRTLTVSNNNKCNFVRGYKRIIGIKVTLPHLMYLENNGVGVVRLNKAFKQDSVSVRVASSGDVHVEGNYGTIKTSSNGNGDMYIRGTAKKLYVYTNGINYVNAEELRVSDYMFIHSVTIGDCYVNATGTKKMDYNIQKDGNIYYIGEPDAMQDFSDVAANGRVIRKL
jgi:hypothetical protein